MISREDAKEILVQYCEGGIKHMDLIPHLAKYCAAFPVFSKFDIPELLEELVVENRLVEIEYVLPQYERTIKSFFLPVGTEIQSIRGPFKGARVLP